MANGVGKQAQEAVDNAKLPITLVGTDGSAEDGTFTTPVIKNSDLPGLLGLNALEQKRAIIDHQTNTLYFLGQGPYDLSKAMPPGTTSYKLQKAQSGHLLLPVTGYSSSRMAKRLDQTQVTLVTDTQNSSVSTVSSGGNQN